MYLRLKVLARSNRSVVFHDFGIANYLNFAISVGAEFLRIISTRSVSKSAKLPKRSNEGNENQSLRIISQKAGSLTCRRTNIA